MATYVDSCILYYGSSVLKLNQHLQTVKFVYQQRLFCPVGRERIRKLHASLLSLNTENLKLHMWLQKATWLRSKKGV